MAKRIRDSDIDNMRNQDNRPKEGFLNRRLGISNLKRAFARNNPGVDPRSVDFEGAYDERSTYEENIANLQSDPQYGVYRWQNDQEYVPPPRRKSTIKIKRVIRTPVQAREVIRAQPIQAPVVAQQYNPMTKRFEPLRRPALPPGGNYSSQGQVSRPTYVQYVYEGPQPRESWRYAGPRFVGAGETNPAVVETRDNSSSSAIFNPGRGAVRVGNAIRSAVDRNFEFSKDRVRYNWERSRPRISREKIRKSLPSQKTYDRSVDAFGFSTGIDLFGLRPREQLDRKVVAYERVGRELRPVYANRARTTYRGKPVYLSTDYRHRRRRTSGFGLSVADISASWWGATPPRRHGSRQSTPTSGDGFWSGLPWFEV